LSEGEKGGGWLVHLKITLTGTGRNTGAKKEKNERGGARGLSVIKTGALMGKLGENWVMYEKMSFADFKKPRPMGGGK